MITSFRMYNAGPKAAAAWRALFDKVFADAGVDVDVIDHKFPAPIDTLWSEPDLCCAFMCGWPFARSTSGMQPIAAPIPSPPRYEGLPRYCSDFVVREESGWSALEETFGHRFGWMAANSQSGFNAPRAHLAEYIRPDRACLFAEVKGPLGAPMTTLDALRNGEVDVVALDGFWLDLLRHHEPGRWQGLRVVASTAWTPIPLLVAAPGVSPEAIGRVRATLLALRSDAAYAPLLKGTLLTGFAPVDAGAYGVLDRMAAAARAAGYAEIR